MNPPLRLESDRLAVIEGFEVRRHLCDCDGPRPHHADEKNVLILPKHHLA